MEVAYLLSFLGGLAVGLVLLLIFKSAPTPEMGVKSTHDPVLNPTTCENGVITVTGSAGTTPTTPKTELLGFIAETREVCPSECPDLPSGQDPAPFPLQVNGAGSGVVVVWSVYRTIGYRCVAYDCSEQPPPPQPA